MTCDASAPRGRRRLGETAPHRDRCCEREQGERSDRDAPTDDSARERDAKPAHESAGDERGDVVAHRPRPDPGHECLDDVGRTDGEQPRHAQPLEQPADEERLEPGGESDTNGRWHEQQAGHPNRAGATDPIGDRPPGEAADRNCENDDRNGEARTRRADAEVAGELGEDRLGRVHRGEHPRGPEHEPGERVL